MSKTISLNSMFIIQGYDEEIFLRTNENENTGLLNLT
jgi:hypothetical protein